MAIAERNLACPRPFCNVVADVVKQQQQLATQAFFLKLAAFALMITH